jgi:MFS family permease
LQYICHGWTRMNTDRKSPILLGLGLALGVVCVAYPLYVIRPFRAQGPRGLQAALTVLRMRPLLLGMAVGLALAGVIFYWNNGARGWRRALAVCGALLTVAVAGLSRVNVYELMFHPLDRPAFAEGSDTKLDSDEKVIAIAIGGAARAYPVRSMSYHHIVNDEVGGVPIVATY